MVVSGCATQHRPLYDAVTELNPNCKNKDAEIRYLTKLKRFPTQGDVSTKAYDQTLDIQIDRLNFYCQNEH